MIQSDVYAHLYGGIVIIFSITLKSDIPSFKFRLNINISNNQSVILNNQSYLIVKFAHLRVLKTKILLVFSFILL